MKLLCVAAFLSGLAANGCHYGVRIEDLRPAHQPQGVTMTLDLYPEVAGEKRIAGELLEVREDGLLLNVQMGWTKGSRKVKLT